ncbi:MAG: acyltransferase domain-containing protein [Deltaproteobacteria bacterium]|nr:acyltransferase domain-containing protein [Deltaproteobacteria bacterium]
MAESPIAVVGLACRFPGASDADRFFSNVLADVYSIAPLPPDRFHSERYYDPELGAYGKSYSRLGGLVEPRPFDATFFRMPPKVVEATDVAQLWALDVAKEVIIDAGFEPDALTGRDVGVIVGHARGSMLGPNLSFSVGVEGMVRGIRGAPSLAGKSEKDLLALERQVVEAIHAKYPVRDEDGGVGTIASALAGRISSAFGLTGRHMVVDAACASSFAALEVGVNAIQQGRLEMALVGGASYSQELSVVLFAQSRALSADGSFPFDRRANGFISSDGFGLFLLMPLERALSEGRRVRAVIRGVGGSCDGKGKALWAPRREGQVLAMRRAYEAAGIDPSTVGFIEAHATSTPIGDATEVSAVHEVFARHLGGRRLPIGSVKGNIGHCREAAGAAGLVKAILALERQTIPPTGNFREPTPEIPWGDVCVEVAREPRPFTSIGGEPRRAGASAFGIGGLNYHVIVEEAPPARRVVPSAGVEAPPRIEPSPSFEPIAVVGLGCRFPEARSPAELWKNLLEAKDLFSDPPPDRWRPEIYWQKGDRAPYRTYSKKGAFVSDFSADWRRYKVPPKLVEHNDPLQFMLLESALDALADGAIDPAKLDRTRVGVVMGTVFGSDYALELGTAIRSVELGEALERITGVRGISKEATDAIRRGLPGITEDSSGSFSSSTLASRIAKTLDFMGPTFTVDSACASSLISLEVSVELLRRGQVDLMVYGGGDRAMRVQRYEAYCQFYAISRTDEAHPFDEAADGFLPGEGAGVCILERLEDAKKRGHRIHAIIRGVGTASDGERKSMHKPSARGLAIAMERALTGSGVARHDVGFIECHGAGTPSGDRAEAKAISEVYLADARSSPLVLGSVKSNLGHTQGAAGVASFIKATLALETRTIPPTRGFQKANAELGFERGLAVNTKPISLDEPAVAVSSLGLGGIDAHVVLSSAEAPPKSAALIERRSPAERRGNGLAPIDDRAEPPVLVAPPKVIEPSRPLLPSAAAPRTSASPPRPTPETLSMQDWIFTLRANGAADLERLVATIDSTLLFRDRSIGEGQAVAVLVARTVSELSERLSMLAKTGVKPSARAFLAKQGVFVRARDAEAGRLAFAFSGQGSQYPGMFAALESERPEAKEALARIDRWLVAAGRPALSPVVLSGSPIPADVFVVQAAVLGGDLMAYAALTGAGVRPDIVTGHSYGDYAALVAAGAWDLETALIATARRAEAIEATVQPGGMASVIAPLVDVERTLRKLGLPSGAIAPSNINAPKQTVISGTPEALERAASAFAAAGIEVRVLDVPRAFHSPLMAAARDRLRETLADLEIRTPSLPYLSSVTGRVEVDPEAIRASLVEQLTRPVNFITQVDALVAQGVRAFVESGPKAVLAGLVAQILETQHPDLDADVSSSDDAKTPGAWAIARVLAMLESRSRVAESSSIVSLFSGDEADAMMSTPGFHDFWLRTRPSVGQLVRSLFEAHSQLPTARPEPIEAEREAAPEASISEPQPFQADADPEEVRAFLLKTLSEQTGYPEDIIDPSADMEADLGIDTVKQAQVLGKVRDRYGLRTDEKLSLADFPTLDHVHGYVVRMLASRPKETKPRRAVPTIDVTARRSQRPRDSELRLPSPELAAASTPPVDLARPIEVISKVRVEDVSPGESQLAPTSELPVTQTIVLHLEGTAREIGRQHGEQLKSSILDVMDRYAGFIGAEVVEKLAASDGRALLPTMFDDASLEEVRGVAEAVGLPLEYLLAYNLDSALFPGFSPGCIQIARTARQNGKLIHVANEDSPLLLHLGAPMTRVVQVRRRSDGPDPERKTVAFSLAGQIAGVNALSDTGLTITSCALLDTPDPGGLPTGLPHPQIVKRIVESAGSIEEALETARGARRSGRWSMMISDAAQDRISVLEYDGERVLLEREVEDQWVSTNHASSARGDRIPEHSRLRKDRALELLEGQTTLEVAHAKELLRDQVDLGRGRRVAFPTMNTIRRVDNAMSLVVEPSDRLFHVTDRLEGPRPLGETRFLTIEYGRDGAPPPSTPPASQVPVEAPEAPRSVRTLGPDGHGLVAVDEVMRRYVIRALSEAAPSVRRPFTPRRVLLVGNCERAKAITSRLVQRGARVDLVSDCHRALVELERLGGPAAFDALGIVLPAHKTERPWTTTSEVWSERRTQALVGPFQLLRAYAPFRESGTVFGVTVMGGGLGFDNVVQGAPEGGALIGLLKAVRREHSSLVVQALDISPSSPGDQVADALFAELDAGSPRLEVGSMRGKRMRLAMAPLPARGGSSRSLPERWVITGGARGVTAKIGERLAELYQPELHLIGRTKLPAPEDRVRMRNLSARGIETLKSRQLEVLRSSGQPFSPRDWKEKSEELDRVIEIDENIRRMEALGSRVVYHAIDVANRSELERVLEDVRRSGPIQGILHGAGVEVARRFEKKTDELFDATVGGKVDGLFNILSATRADPLTHLLAFSSVSGRFGGLGQADYALANEAMARLVAFYRDENPDVAVTVMSWPAWSEVGLAARPSSKAVLEQAGQTFMSPAEGANHVIRELWSGCPESEVVFTDHLESLDLDGLLPARGALPMWSRIEAAVGDSPLLDHLILLEGDENIAAERTIFATEPFLDEHRMGGTPILPAVIGLEMMMELVGLTSEQWTIGEVEILTPLKLAAEKRAVVRVSRHGDRLEVTSTARRGNGVVLEPDRVHIVGRRAPKRALPTGLAPSLPTDRDPVVYPYPDRFDDAPGSRMMFHGPVFRGMKGVFPGTEGRGLAKLVVPAVEALVAGSRPERWYVPAALLDSCLQSAGLLGRVLHSITALPIGFKRIDIAPRAMLATDQAVTLEIRMKRDGDALVSDLVAFDANGALLMVEGYRAQAVPGA